MKAPVTRVHFNCVNKYQQRTRQQDAPVDSRRLFKVWNITWRALWSNDAMYSLLHKKEAAGLFLPACSSERLTLFSSTSKIHWRVRNWKRSRLIITINYCVYKQVYDTVHAASFQSVCALRGQKLTTNLDDTALGNDVTRAPFSLTVSIHYWKLVSADLLERK